MYKLESTVKGASLGIETFYNPNALIDRLNALQDAIETYVPLDLYKRFFAHRDVDMVAHKDADNFIIVKRG